MLRAAGEASTSVAFPTALIVLVAAATIFGFGHRVAVASRARSDHLRAKAAMPGMRKARWSTLWSAVKVGFWLAIGGFLLLAWVVHDARQVAGR